MTKRERGKHDILSLLFSCFPFRAVVGWLGKFAKKTSFFVLFPLSPSHCSGEWVRMWDFGTRTGNADFYRGPFSSLSFYCYRLLFVSTKMSLSHKEYNSRLI